MCRCAATSARRGNWRPAGIDVIIAQGHEAGGHTGRIGTMTLVPMVADAVEVPVLAAGGIADGRGLLAAIMLNAQGIWMGTRFIASVEAYAHFELQASDLGDRRRGHHHHPMSFRQAMPID